MKFQQRANHEMNRELLWRNYPTDMRGTPLRHFWSVRGVKPRTDTSGHTIDAASDEYFMDIKNIHQWKSNGLHTALGGNTARTVSPSNMVVLAIRGELFNKYPNAMVYARKAILQTKVVSGITKPDTSKPRLADPLALTWTGNGENPYMRTPIFSARVDDIIFIGFSLNAIDAKGKEYNGSNHAEALSNPGWHFVIEERAGEPVFGADKASSIPANFDSWDKLSWIQLYENNIEPNFINVMKNIQINPLSTFLEDKNTKWGSNSADMAYATYQRPSRIYLHGSDMLATP